MPLKFRIGELFFRKVCFFRNAEFSGDYFYMKMNIKGDFQICISVPLKAEGHHAIVSVLEIKRSKI